MIVYYFNVRSVSIFPMKSVNTVSKYTGLDTFPCFKVF
jgi:hypothetical protein